MMVVALELVLAFAVAMDIIRIIEVVGFVVADHSCW